MGYFEQYPWLLVPLIVITVEGWNLLKAAALDLLRRRFSERLSEPRS